MTRKTLLNAIRDASLPLGYCFHSGPDAVIGQRIIAYPAVWLSPPKVIASSGWLEGRVTYRVSLHLMSLAAKKHKETEPEQVWEELEADALGLCRGLDQAEGISSATLIECAPSQFAITPHAEVAVTLKMDVVVPFCNL